MQLRTPKRASFDEGSLDQYLREISQYPLITREEEPTPPRAITRAGAEALDRRARPIPRFCDTTAKKDQYRGVTPPHLIKEDPPGLTGATHKSDEKRAIKI